MKIALIADLHANADALAALTPDLTAADTVVCLGDLVGYYCQPNEAVEAMRALGARCVRGNHDAWVLNDLPDDVNDAVRFGIRYAQQTLTAENRAWLAELPLMWEGMIGGRSLLLAHGSPWHPLDDYLYADSPRIADLGHFDTDVISVGQTHRALVRPGPPLLINPGSVGQSRDIVAHACMALLDTDTLAVTQIARPYNPSPTIARARAHGAGAWITKHLVS